MHKKIFWLEDHPDFSAITCVENLSDGKINSRTLLENTVFAYDFNSAKEILTSGNDEFELYITDGDFPLGMQDSQKKRVGEFLKELQEKGETRNFLEGGFKNQYYNAFIEFTLDYLLNKDFVVHSMSQDAKQLAFLLGWPFYEKRVQSNGDKPQTFFLNRETFYHNDVTSSVPREIFDKVYNFISKSSRWKIDESLPNFFELKKTPELLDAWVYGDSRSLVKERIVPLLKK